MGRKYEREREEEGRVYIQDPRYDTKQAQKEEDLYQTIFTLLYALSLPLLFSVRSDIPPSLFFFSSLNCPELPHLLLRSPKESPLHLIYLPLQPYKARVHQAPSHIPLIKL